MASGVAGTGTVPALIHIGCAGWSIPAAVRERFPSAGSHLVRYASAFNAVEINTSFYRPHRAATYTRWRDSVPESFRFSAKVPKAITHEARLHAVDDALEKFVGEVSHLEHKLGCMLVQLPPSLPFDVQAARRFFRRLRVLTPVELVVEPRHKSWFTPAAVDIVTGLGVAYVDADPPVASLPFEDRLARTAYLRMHGSPVIYHSAYPDEVLEQLAQRVTHHADAGRHVWCIFDNTASGAAVPNALSLSARFRLPEAATV